MVHTVCRPAFRRKGTIPPEGGITNGANHSLQILIAFRLGIQVAILVAAMSCVCPVEISNAQDESPKAENNKAGNGNRIVATVDDFEITQADVERQLRRTPGLSSEKYLPVAFSIATNHLVDRELVFRHIKTEYPKLLADKNEITMRAELLKQQLSKVGKSMSDYLFENGLSANQMRRQVTWEITWKKFIGEQLNDEAISKFFEDRRSCYDGTQLKVAQILWRKPIADKSDSIQRANSVRDEIVADTKTWEDAVKEFSQAASRDKGGELGWIKFDAPMPTVFSKAAFELAVGEISPPVESAFGLHVIKCLEIETGKLELSDVIDRVREDATTQLFQAAVKEQRSRSKILLHSQ